MSNQQGQLNPDLKIRHISMISIAGVIGAGLFIGSGAVINSSGPGAILSYAFQGQLSSWLCACLVRWRLPIQQADLFLLMQLNRSGRGRVLQLDGYIGFSGLSL